VGAELIPVRIWCNVSANYRLQCGPVAALNMKAADLALTMRSVPHHSKNPRLIDDVTVVLAGIGAIISE
jgi:hypothetical protein